MGGQESADAYSGFARVAFRKPSGALIFPPVFVEEFGIAAVIVAAEEGPVTDLYEAALLEDPLHAVVMGQGGAADGAEAQSVEDVVEEERNGLGGVAPTPQVSGTNLYAQFASIAAEIVEGGHADGLPSGFYDKSLDARIIPAGQVIATGRR